MRVIEQLVIGKLIDTPEACEDTVVVTDEFAAVIDGATDATSHQREGMSAGRYAMGVLTEAVLDLPGNIDAPAAIEHLSACLAVAASGAPAGVGRPTASVTLYSAARREIWQVGDVDYWYPGHTDGSTRPGKRVDTAAAEMRAAILATHLAAGEDLAMLAEQDPGRAAIIPLLARQGLLCNNPNPALAAWSFGALDGRPVPAPLYSVHPLPANVTELAIASDGYPAILPTLDQSEKHLASLLAHDPLCIGPLRGTKAPRAGLASYDDRAYLRLAVAQTRR